MSGVRITYNLTKPSGSRIESVYVLCANCTEPVYENLVTTKIYKIIIPMFLQFGGNGYKMFKVKFMELFTFLFKSNNFVFLIFFSEI